MNINDCKSIGQIAGRYVDERARKTVPEADATEGRRPTKLDMLRLYTRSARILGHSQPDQRFHLELIRLSKASDYEPARRVVLAHSNAYLAARCGMSRTGLGRQLRRHDGRTLCRSTSGNGHRFVARRQSAANDGAIVEACGISLEPLIALMLEMRAVIAAQDDLQFGLEIEKARIGRDRRRQRDVIATLGEAARCKALELANESKALAGEIRSAFAGGRLAELQQLGLTIASITARIEAMAGSGGPPDNAPLRTPQGPGSGHQLQIQMPLESVSVAAVGKGPWKRAERAGNHGAPQRMSWWTPRSIRAVFPGFSLYVTAAEPSWHDIAEGAGRLARDLGINASCWEQARSSMGAEQRLVALGLVAELLSQGRIASSAGQYFGGLLKKARIGALDLDRSVWGLQQRRADVGVNPPLREIGAEDRDVSP